MYLNHLGSNKGGLRSVEPEASRTFCVSEVEHSPAVASAFSALLQRLRAFAVASEVIPPNRNPPRGFRAGLAGGFNPRSLEWSNFATKHQGRSSALCWPETSRTFSVLSCSIFTCSVCSISLCFRCLQP